MAETTPATTTASWGVTGTVSTVSGVVTDIECGAEAILAPEYDEKGRVIKQTHYDTKKTATATVEVPSSASLPTECSAITIGSFSGYVTSARLVESNQAYRKISVTAESYTNCSATTSAT